VVAGGGDSLGGGADHLGAALTFAALVSTCTQGCESALSPAERYTVARPPATSTCASGALAESLGTHARGGSALPAALALGGGAGAADDADADVDGGVVADGLLGEQAKRAAVPAGTTRRRAITETSCSTDSKNRRRALALLQGSRAEGFPRPHRTMQDLVAHEVRARWPFHPLTPSVDCVIRSTWTSVNSFRAQAT
jgi:hypothetical protein